MGKTVSPTFTTYRRNRTTGELEGAPPSVQGTYSVGPKERKTIEIPLPKGVNPQAYDVVVALNEGDIQVSNEVTVHYVVQGESGTIQNVLLDKDWYTTGDIANVVVTFTRSADNFPDARNGGQGSTYGDIAIEVTLKDKDGSLCASSAKKVLNGNDLAQTDIPLTITFECIKPTVIVKLINNDTGVLLDEMSAELGSEYVPAPQVVSEEKGVFRSFWFVLLGLSLVLLIIAGVLKITKSKNGIPTIVAFFIVCSVYAIGTNETKADTIYTYGAEGLGALSMTYNLNKSTYTVGDTMVASISGAYIQCTNKYRATMYTYVKPNVAVGFSLTPDEKKLASNSFLNLIGKIKDLGKISETYASAYWAGYSNSKTFIVPSTWNPINPKATFHFYAYLTHKGRYIGANNNYRDIPYTLVVPKCAAEANRSGCELPETNYGSSAGSCALGYAGSCNYTCSGGVWTENSNTCTLNPAVTDFTVTPNPVPYGESATISWSSLNTTSCTAGGDWSGTKGTSGNELTGPITAPKTYTLYCEGPLGTSNTVTINLQVACAAQDINGCRLPLTGSGDSAGVCLPGFAGNCSYVCSDGLWNLNSNTCNAPVISEFKVCDFGETNCVSSGDKPVIINTTFEIHWDATNADFCTAVSGPGFSTGNVVSGMDTAPTGAVPNITNTYSIGCGNGGVFGATKSINVTSREPIPTITTSSRVVEEGDSVTLSWNTLGADPASCSITGGGLNMSSLGTFTGTVSVVVNARSTYTITCGTNSGNVTVEVTPRAFET